jgi:hypothetical protein
MSLFKVDKKIFPYSWAEAHKWSMEDKISGVHWVLEGFRLLVFAGTDLVLYQDKIIACSVAINKPVPQNNGIKFCLNSDEEIKWEIIWITFIFIYIFATSFFCFWL